MDGIFSRKNFQNEIVWCYKEREMNKKKYNQKHDVIFLFSKNSDFYFDWKLIAEPYSQTTLNKFRYKDDKGLYQIRGKGVIGSPVYKADGLRPEHEKKHPGLTYRQYIAIGVPPRDWIEVPIINKASKERLGYPTQKPLALLERIIKASCPEGGTVLDPFCGCGTSIDAAIRNQKKWIGIDISSFSIDIIKNRIKSGGIEEKDFSVQYIRPKTWEEYNHLNAYEKQDFLIGHIGGMPNPRKSGDGGVDGELTIHKGIDKKGEDIWGKVIFSVKTGKQANPAMIRELKGTMKNHNADIGVLLLDKDPSPNMAEQAESSKKLKYRMNEKMEYQEYDTIQIYTATQILDGVKLDVPPVMLRIKEYKKLQRELFA